MRIWAFVLAVAALVLGAASLAAAQPGGYAAAELVLAGDLPVAVETAWASGRRGRSATVVARAGGRARTLHDGATVRTAAAGRPGALAVVAFHGGEAPFARVLVAAVGPDGAGEPVAVEIDRSAARARSATLRPAAAVVAATAGGFAVLLQEQEADPSAAVVTTLTRLDAAGTVVEATHAVAIPWQLGALAARPDGGYELLVVYGGASRPDRPAARACVVSLSAAGEPTEHPWWASDEEAYADLAIALDASGAIVVAWRGADATSVRATRWPGDGGWGRAPAAIETLASIGADVPFALAAGEGGLVVRTP